MATTKIVGIENSIYGKPMLIKEVDGKLVFTDLPTGITRIEELNNNSVISTDNKLHNTEHSNA
jgi:hypothetical protein